MQANSRRRTEKRKRHSASSGDERRKRQKWDGRRKPSSTCSEEEEEDDSATEDGQVSRRTRSRGRYRDPQHERNRHKGKARRQSPSLTESSDYETSGDAETPLNSGSWSASSSPSAVPCVGNDHLAFRTVYRAIYEERIHNIGLDQAPCTRCPTFDFCQSGGPIEPQACVYYESWLDRDETQVISS